MFEHSLIDLEAKQQPRRRRWISLPIAVGLHVVGLTAFAFASYWSVGNVPEPSSLNVVFFDLKPLPPPPGGGGGRQKPISKPEQKETPAPKPRETVQPTNETVPDVIPKPDPTASTDDLLPASNASDEFPGTGDGPVGPGVGPGDGPGVGPGPGGPGDGPDIGPGDSLPVRLTVDMTKPEILKRVQPRYTDIARRAGVQGTVIVEAVIDEKGYVTNARVLRGLPMGLDQEAVDAILQWRFKPAYQGSRAIKVYFTLTVNFTIQR